MEYRILNETGQKVSALGFGVWTVSTTMWGITDYVFAVKMLKRAFDLGINFYDTADVYGDGEGETILANALGSHRDELVIATKFGYDFYNHPGLQEGQRERPHDWSSVFVRKACEESLRRLNTDRIDLYQLHNPRMDALENDELFETLEALKQEGKLKGYAAALGPALKPDRQVEEGLYCVEKRRMPIHIIYNMLEQQIGEVVCPAAEANNVSILVRVPHASGVLEGSYSTDTTFAPTDHRSHRVTTNEMKRKWLYDGLLKLEKLRFACEGAGRTPAQMAIQWLLSKPSIRGIFPNIYDEAQLQEFASASETPPFSEEELNRVEDLYRHDFYLEEPVEAV